MPIIRRRTAKIKTLCLNERTNMELLHEHFKWNVIVEREGEEPILVPLFGDGDILHFFKEYWDWEFAYTTVGTGDGIEFAVAGLCSEFDDFKQRHQHGVQRAVEAYFADYNPLDNYDRTEQSKRTMEHGEQIATDYGKQSSTDYGMTIDSTDHSKLGEQTESGRGINDSGDLVNGTGVKTTSYTSTYDAGEKEDGYTTNEGSTGHKAVGESTHGETHGGNDTNKLSGTDTEKHSGTDTEATEAYIRGNIGVTTSQQMLQAEVDLRFKEDLRTWCFQTFAKESLFMGVDDDDC